MKTVHKSKKVEPKKVVVYKSQGETIKDTFIKRCGIIPYTCINGILYFLLGHDFRTNELTDFGGGAQKDETAPITAFREFKEETLDIFELTSHTALNKTMVVYNEMMAIYFLPVDDCWYDIAQYEFAQNYKNNRIDHEISSIEWIQEYELRYFLESHNTKFWIKVQTFLNQTVTRDFMNKLRTLYNEEYPDYDYKAIISRIPQNESNNYAIVCNK